MNAGTQQCVYYSLRFLSDTSSLKRFLNREDPLEKGMATHPSILAWEISRTEEPGELQSEGLQRVRNQQLSNNSSCHLRSLKAKDKM